jgi:hypothetical protein
MGRYLDICKEVMRDRWAKQAAALLAQVRDDDLRAALRHRFEERAGVYEYDGDMSRDEAERIAFEEVRSVWNRHLDDLGESSPQERGNRT